MPSDVILGPIYTAVKALLAAHAPLTVLLGVKPLGASVPAIYDEGSVPQAHTSTVGWRPYLAVGLGTQTEQDRTFGAEGQPVYGWTATFQIKAVGQVSELEILTVMSKVLNVLYDGRELSLAGYASAFVDSVNVQPTLSTLQAGVLTRELPAIVRVTAHD